MVRTVAVYAFGFAVVGVADSLVQSMGAGDDPTVNVGLVVALFVTGVVGGVMVERPLRD